MFYIILIAAVVFALVLLFRDDHDGSYDRRGDSRRRYQSESQQPPSQAPVPPKPSSVKTAPADKTTVRSPEPPKSEYPVPDRTLSWSYLYSLEYDEDICGDTMETEITGMRYYCSLADLGPVNGIVKPEPDNPHDHRAQVVIRSDGKKLGYIPRYALDEYEDFNEDGLVCPFAGLVKVDHNGYMHADILVALPESMDFVKEELTDYLENL